jgi:hypothetical protein
MPADAAGPEFVLFVTASSMPSLKLCCHPGASTLCDAGGSRTITQT